MRNTDKVELRTKLDSVLTENRDRYIVSWKNSPSAALRQQYRKWCIAQEKEVASTLEEFGITTDRVSLSGLYPQVLIADKAISLAQLM
jgi:hypothetical protein